jgi:hypothetical protein
MSLVLVSAMVFAVSFLVFGLLAILVAGALGSLGGTDVDLNAIVGGGTFVLAGLAVGLGALLLSGEAPQAGDRGPGRERSGSSEAGK